MCIANDAGERRRQGPSPIRRRTPARPGALSVRGVGACLLLSAMPCVPAFGQTPAADPGAAKPAAEAPAAAAAAREASPFAVEVGFAQFVQGPVSGGVEQAGEYGGKLELELKIDTHGLGLWPGGTLEAKAATRYGETASGHAGAAMPINTALIDPATEGTATSLIALNYTQLLPLGKTPGNALVVAFGRFSTFEMIPEGTGMTGYLNVAQIAPTHEARNVPAVTLGATMALVLGGEPVASLLVIDSRSSAMTSGLSDLFENGVTVSPSLTIPTRFFGRAGHQGLRATWSSQSLTPFDEIPHLFIPRPDSTVTVERESGGWTVVYTADQYLQENRGPPRTGWRLYWQAGVADERTNPIGRYFNVGVFATHPFRGRPLDRAGLGWAYTGWGDDFRDLIGRLVEIEDEQSVEMFYNLAIGRWVHLTGDLQVVWPFLPRAETAVIPGVRLEFVF
jgi:porin